MSMKEDRAREGKKARYRKMGFGPMMDSGEIDFGDKHPLTKKRLKNFKKKENPMADERFNAGFRAKAKKAGLKDSEIGDTRLKGGGMSSGQAKLAAKAPPTNKIDAKDFAVLRAEKAKGRGMGLQDESVQPGKVMKAKKGMSFSDKMKAVEDGKINKKTGKPTSMAAMREMKGFKPGESASEFMKRRKELGAAGKALSATRIGKIVLPVAAAGVAASQYLKSKMKKKDKKMGGGMMKKYSKGGGADSGTVGEMKSRIGVAMNKAKRLRSTDRLTERDIKKASSLVKGKMGGGSVKKYSDGMSYKDMAPYGGKYAKKKNEMKATASENVKRLTTQPDAYNPEARYLVGEKRKRNSTVRTVRKTTDQVNLREAANKLKEQAGPGFNVSINTKSDLIRKRLIRPKRMAGRMGGGMIGPSQRPGYSKGTMVKARGCKLGRTRPTKIT